jgi:hypothetical protein
MIARAVMLLLGIGAEIGDRAVCPGTTVWTSSTSRSRSHAVIQLLTVPARTMGGPHGRGCRR